MKKRFLLLVSIFNLALLNSCSLFYPYLNVKSYVNKNSGSLVGVLLRDKSDLIKIKNDKNEEDFLNDFSSIKRSNKDKGDKCGLDEFYVVYYSSKNDNYFGYGRRIFLIFDNFSIDNLEEITIRESNVCYAESINKYFEVCNNYFDLPWEISVCA